MTRSRRSGQIRRREKRPTLPSNASIAAYATRPAIRCGGTRTIWARRRSPGPGRWSTTNATAAISPAFRPSPAPAAVTLAIHINPAKSFARRRSIRPPPLQGSNAGPRRPISKERSRYERAALSLAARHRRRDGAAGGGSYRRDLLCHTARHERGRHSFAHPRQHCLGRVLWLAVSIHASIGVRNVLSEWTPLNERSVDACAVFFGL